MCRGLIEQVASSSYPRGPASRYSYTHTHTQQPNKPHATRKMMRRLVTTTLRSRPPPPPPSSSSLLQRRSFASANATNSAPASPTIIIEANTHTSTSTTDTTDTHTNQTTPGWGLFPEDIVQHLDRYVIGQEDAKKATAIALRMRWRRNQLEDDIRGEVTPSNIMMKGPTGSGKTEIARRLSTLAEAPFIKVEATR